MATVRDPAFMVVAGLAGSLTMAALNGSPASGVPLGAVAERDPYHAFSGGMAWRIGPELLLPLA